MSKRVKNCGESICKILGEVFKELRKSRNVSLQEATGGEFTYSMLSKFERGEAELSSMKLITALDNINSDLNEFMYLVRGFSQKKFLAFLRKSLGTI